MTRRLPFACVASLFFCFSLGAVLQAAEKPDFSGRWVLDAEASHDVEEELEHLT